MKDLVASNSSQDINARIASRVRALRREQGLSLEVLATQSGVSRSMLSLIERGESSPTAVVLDKLATGLGVVLATLFEDKGAEANSVSRREDRTTWRDPQSGYVRRNISPAGFPSPFQLVEVVMPAGASVQYDTGPRDVNIQQQLWVQEGRLEVTHGSVTHHLTEDDCLAMTLDAPTAFRNPADKPTRYLVVVTRAQRGR